MTPWLNRVLPGGTYLGYDGAVAATLQRLELFVLYDASDQLVASVRDSLAKPLDYSPPAEDPQALAYGSVLPQDLATDPNYLFFHVDIDDPAPGAADQKCIIAHLSYRHRPNANPPKRMQEHREAGWTVAWAEQFFGAAGEAVVAVEAQLTLPKGERPEQPITTRTVGEVTLTRSGEEYVGKSVLGEVNRYRWLESSDGATKIWLGYSHKGLETTRGLWTMEGERCLTHLQKLGK